MDVTAEIIALLALVVSAWSSARKSPHGETYDKDR